MLFAKLVVIHGRWRGVELIFVQVISSKVVQMMEEMLFGIKETRLRQV